MSLKFRLISSIISDLRSQYRCPPKSATAKILTKIWANESFPVVNAIVDKLDVKPDDRVLEIGFGRGDGLKLAYEKVKNGNGYIFGLEASEYMYDLACQRFITEMHDEKNIFLDLIPNIVHLPYPNDTFDSIFHVDVFYFWNSEGMPLIAKELFRIIKPEGKLVCGLEMKKLKLLERRKILTAEEYDPMRYAEQLEPAGFADVSVDYEKITSSREAMIITARRPGLSEEDLDPEIKMKKLENQIKRELALASLISSQKPMPEKLKAKLDDSQGI